MRWQGYLDWRPTSLDRLVTLDTFLCPDFVKTLTREDWDHNAQEDYVAFWFRDLDYLLNRTAGKLARRVLPGWRQPPETLPDREIAAAADNPRIAFRGCDLFDMHGDISALTNCTGFDRARSDAELNSAGLLDSVTRSYEIQAALKRHHAGHGHEESHVWAVWEMISGDPA